MGITSFLFFSGLAYVPRFWVEAQDLSEASLDDARFPISRGVNFTFQPSAGAQCHWAVAQYPGSRKEFFVLDASPACPGLADNSTTLLLRFGSEVVPGNASLTVQCDEPSVWQFIVSLDEPVGGRKTTLNSICDAEGTNGRSDGWHSPMIASGPSFVSPSAGRLRPTSLMGYPGNWSFSPTGSMSKWLTSLSTTPPNPIASIGKSGGIESPVGADPKAAPGASTGLPLSVAQSPPDSLSGSVSTLSKNDVDSPTSSGLDRASQSVPLSGLQDQPTAVGSAPPTTQAVTDNLSGTRDPNLGPYSIAPSPTTGAVTSNSIEGARNSEGTATGTSPCTCTC